MTFPRRGLGLRDRKVHHWRDVSQIRAPRREAGLVWMRARILALVNSATLTVNYSVKQSQFTKPTSEPRASDPKESNEAFDRAIRGWLL